MASRSDLKGVIDEWSGWLKRAAHDQYPRPVSFGIPEKHALALIGVRRCGKSFAAASLVTASTDVLCINFEDPYFIEHHSVALLDEIVSVFTEFSMHSPHTLLFDEIHNIDGWERWVRKMVDLKRYRIVLTGSSAKMLSMELATTLTGRCVTQTVWPLSFREFLSFTKISCANADEYLGAFRGYLQWGGFPEVVLAPAEKEKKTLLAQYLTDILYKDIIKRNEIRSPKNLEVLVRYYLTNISSLHSYNSVRKAFALNVETVRDYTLFLQDAFLVFEVSRYHPNMKVQSRDAKKIYAIDTGLRNANASSSQSDFGKLVENVVYLELRRRGKEICYFKEKGETDFLVTHFGKPEEAIQVCYGGENNEGTWKREVDALLECLKVTHLDDGMILTQKREETQQLEGKTISFIPLHKWLLSDVACL